MKHKRGIISVVSILIVMIVAAGTLMLNTKSSEAQQAPQACESRTYTCQESGTGISPYQATARNTATDNCNNNLRTCQQQKSTECAQFCMRQNCIPSTQITPGTCSTPQCTTATLKCDLNANGRIGIKVGNKQVCELSVDVGGGITVGATVQGYMCSSNGRSSVQCNCLEEGRSAASPQ